MHQYKIKPTFFITVIISLFLVSSCAPRVENDLKEIMDDYDAVGLSVAVVKDNQIQYTHSFGYKDKANKIPLADDDLFRIASISKSFSATVIMQLVEEDSLSLDDKVSDLIGFNVENPNYPDTAITLRMLLSHASSISDKNGYFNLDVINPDKDEDWKNSYNDYKPGTEYEYCNLCFNMIGAIIERYTHKRFDRAIKHRVLDSLGLDAGYNVDDLDSTRFAMIYHYDADHGKFEESPNAYASVKDKLEHYSLGYDAPIFSPTGGMKISVPDLAKYMRMHMNYGTLDSVNILDENQAKEMQTGRIETDEGYNYGFALEETDRLIPGETMIGHTGDAYGLYSAMFFNPEQKFGFVVITNGSKNPGTKEGFKALLKPVIERLYSHFIQDQ